VPLPSSQEDASGCSSSSSSSSSRSTDEGNLLHSGRLSQTEFGACTICLRQADAQGSVVCDDTAAASHIAHQLMCYALRATY
jgi:hypothetical protein